MKVLLTVLFLTGALVPLFGQQYITSRINLKERQNQMAASIPKILLDAYSKGDIQAYYPKNMDVPVSYAQFLNHFGMINKAYRELVNESPVWFCRDKKPVPADGFVIKCMQYKMELGEKQYQNNITYAQEKKLNYVKIIYASECAVDGVETEGPVFKIGDISKLTDRSYGIVNPQNPAVVYSVSDLLKLKLYSVR